MKKLLLLILVPFVLAGCTSPCEDEQELLKMNLNCKTLEEKSSFSINDSKNRRPVFYSSTYKRCIYVDQWSKNIWENNLVAKFQIKDLMTHTILKEIKEDISYDELVKRIK